MVMKVTHTKHRRKAYPRPKTVKYTTRNTSRTRAVAQPPGRNLQCTAESEQVLRNVESALAEQQEGACALHAVLRLWQQDQRIVTWFSNVSKACSQ